MQTEVQEDEDASEVDYKDFMRGVIAKLGPGTSFVTWRIILNQLVLNSGMQCQKSSILDMMKLYRE